MKSVYSWLLLFATTLLFAGEMPKRTLNTDMTLNYHIHPGEVDDFPAMFSEGIFYGRVRGNGFRHEWKDKSDADGENNSAFGAGGSMIYHTGVYKGVSLAAGMFTSQNPQPYMFGTQKGIDDVQAGKDVFDRRKIQNGGTYTGDWGFSSWALNYIQYDYRKTQFRYGRQIFESFLTASDDTKMIPNTFEGITAVSEDLPDTTVKLARLTKQKLRGHTDFHDVIAYNGYEENDDEAVHRGLQDALLEDHSEDTYWSRILLMDVENRSVRGMKINYGHLIIPQLFENEMLELNYRIEVGDAWYCTPGVRYMAQRDLGAGAIGGAALDGSLAGLSGQAGGYRSARSVDASMTAGRVKIGSDTGYLQLGYSDVADRADLIAPWRGFPTGGYTRSMNQYNWLANTKSSMLQLFYDFDKSGMLKGFRTLFDYGVMDYDEHKGYRDRVIYHMDLWQKVAAIPGMEFKFRTAQVDEDKRGGIDLSYREYRFEMNFLL